MLGKVGGHLEILVPLRLGLRLGKYATARDSQTDSSPHDQRACGSSDHPQRKLEISRHIRCVIGSLREADRTTSDRNGCMPDARHAVGLPS